MVPALFTHGWPLRFASVRFAIAGLIALLGAHGPVRAELPIARMLTVQPSGARSGSTSEVRVAGQDLVGARELIFTHPGISAIPLTNGTSRVDLAFSVIVASHVPPGFYELQVAARYGVSNPRLFSVGLLPEVSIGPDHQSIDKAREVTPGITVNGFLTAGSYTYLRVPVRQGELMVVRCEAAAIDSRLEPVLVVMDAAGREVGQLRSEGELIHRTTGDETLTLRLSDVLFRGGPEYFFRLTLGALPALKSFTPAPGTNAFQFVAAGIALTTNETFSARSLGSNRWELMVSPSNPPAASTFMASPGQLGMDLRTFRWPGTNGVSRLLPFTFPNSPVVMATSHVTGANPLQVLEPPCVVTGELPSGGAAAFQFHSRKGQVWWLEVIADRLGGATDPILLVQRVPTNGPPRDVLELNDQASVAAGVRLNTAHRDPGGRFEAPEEGNYRVLLRDLFTRVGGVAVPYWFSIRRPEPDFQLVLLAHEFLPAKADAKDLQLAATTLRQGETLPVRVAVLRRDGFSGPITFQVTNLPVGVELLGARLEPGRDVGSIWLRAATNGAGSYSALEVSGHGSVETNAVVRVARAVTQVWPVADPTVEALRARATSSHRVSLVPEAMPLRFRSVSPVIDVPAGDKVKVSWAIEAGGELAAPIKFKPIGAVALDAIKEFEVPAAATNVVLEVDAAALKLAGEHLFALQGLAQIKPWQVQADGKKVAGAAVTTTVFSEPVLLRILPVPPKTP